MRFADVDVSSYRAPGLSTWWRRAICFALMATLAFAALAQPVITFHPHVDPHATDAHHAGPIATEERKAASVLEAICLSMDGCHQLGTWLHLDGSRQNVPESGTRLSSGEDSKFASALVAGPLRPPNPLAAAPSDEWVSSSFCEVA
jgi:hypothetical protein